ncbi:MAG: hypothetical protein ACRC62_39960, partial [Microcoleus sp.]
MTNADFLFSIISILKMLLSTIKCQLSTKMAIAGHRPYQLPAINYQLSTINYQLSTINYQLSTIN